MGGAGDSALDPPKYWGQVKDPLMAEYFNLAPSSAEYKRVEAAIALTTRPQQLRIHSIERVQNISLWQSYCVKKSATIAREKDPVAAERKYVRNWSGPVWNSFLGDIVAALAPSSGEEPGIATPSSRRREDSARVVKF